MYKALKLSSIVIGIVVLASVLGIQPCNALEKLRVYRGVLVLEGKIVPGDYTLLRSFLSKRPIFDKISGGVFLASPGGYIDEAIKIGRLIRALRLTTDAPSGPRSGVPKFGESLIRARDLTDRRNYLCTSACFLIYVAGIYRNLNWAGRLGVHQPVQTEKKNRRHKLTKDEETKSNARIRAAIKSYFEEMDVPEKYLDLMFSVPSNKVLWITQHEFDSDLRGYIPEVREWIGPGCHPRKSEREIASAKSQSRPESRKPIQSEKLLKCLGQVKTELPAIAWPKVFSR